MGLVQRDDQEAYAVLFNRHHANIVYFVNSYMRNEATAVEVAAETWFAVWRSRGRFDGSRAGFRVWLYRIARNKAIERIRRESRRPESEFDEGHEYRVPDATADLVDRTIGHESRSSHPS